MALTKRNPNATFEKPAETTQAAQAETASTPQTAEAAAPSPAPAPAPSPAPAPAPAAAAPSPVRAIAPVQSNAVSLMNEGHKFMDSLKDALRVDWDTLTRVKASQGRMAAGNDNFGEWLEFELLSYQDNWLISPGGDSDEAKELARYSDDGVTLKDTGESCQDYIKRLKEMDYKDARMAQRVILVASLLDCDKNVTVDEGMLFQIDLPPTSRAKFTQYRAQAAFDLAKGKITADDVIRIRATANVEQQRGQSKNEYTVLSFSRAKAVAA